MEQEKHDKPGTKQQTSELEQDPIRSTSPSTSHSSIGTTGSFATTWTNDKIIGCCNGFCNADPATKRGRQVQIIRILTILCIPIIGVTAYAIIHLINAIKEEYILHDIKVHTNEASQLIKLVDALVLERSESVMFLVTSNGSKAAAVTENAFLQQFYKDTDKALHGISKWPGELANEQHFENPENFKAFLDKQRDYIKDNQTKVSDDIHFYNKANDIFLNVLNNQLTTTNHHDLWRPLLADKMLSRAKENFGITMAFGIEYYLSCGLPEEDRLEFLVNMALAEDHFTTAKTYAPFIVEEFDKRTARVFGLLLALEKGKEDVIQLRGGECSAEKGHDYFNKMRVYQSILTALSQVIGQDIIEKIEYNVVVAAEDLSLSIFVFIMVTISAPVLSLLVYRLTSTVAQFAQNINQKSYEIAVEKKRTNDLLYSMLPRSVAAALLNKTPVQPSYYDYVTVYFSDIVGFSKLSTISTPLQIVSLLNQLYHFIDEKIEKYDVYKVETIGDVYMIVSGLPHRNGRRHAAEIGKLSIELLEDIVKFTIPHLPMETVRLRIGVHTGKTLAFSPLFYHLNLLIPESRSSDARLILALYI